MEQRADVTKVESVAALQPESEAKKHERLDAILYTLLGGLPPVIIELSSDSVLTVRKSFVLILIFIMAGGTALKAFRSQSKRKVPDEPEQPPAQLVQAPTNPPWP